MYLNLRYQMCKQGITPKMLAEELNLSEKSICNKLSRRTDFTITEANYIIAVIVGLIAIIVALILYWDVVKQKAGEVWASIVAAFEPLGEFFSGLWDGIKAGFKAFINFIIDGINSFTSTLSWIPEELSKVSGFEWAANFVIKPIPNFALGTQYFKGGLAQINERGGEIVDLPNGSKVIPADKSKSMLNGGNVSIGNIYITAKGVTANEVVNEIVPQLKLRLANM